MLLRLRYCERCVKPDFLVEVVASVAIGKPYMFDFSMFDFF